MVEITASAVKTLRDRTDMPMMKCKEALVKAEGDEEGAVELLKQEAGKVLDKRKDNVTTEGHIFVAVSDDGSQASMVEIQCESAPVATGEHLAGLGEQLAKQLLEGPGAANVDELLAQQSPDGSGKTLAEILEHLVGTIRESIVVARITRLEGPVAGYVHHDFKTAVLFQVTGENGSSPVIRDVAMHIAALKPTAVNTDDLDQADVKAERERLTAEAKSTGKPDNIIEKIVDGRMKNYYVEAGVLVMQPFAKDDSKTVSQALTEAGLKAKSFTCWVLGT